MSRDAAGRPSAATTEDALPKPPDVELGSARWSFDVAPPSNLLYVVGAREVVEATQPE